MFPQYFQNIHLLKEFSDFIGHKLYGKIILTVFLGKQNRHFHIKTILILLLKIPNTLTQIIQ